jgi:hypothetical protein
MTKYDTTHITWILNGNGDWFTAKLFRLIASSDMANKEKLALGFPDEVNAIHKHQTGEPLVTADPIDIGEILKKSYIDGAMKGMREE